MLASAIAMPLWVPHSNVDVLGCVTLSDVFTMFRVRCSDAIGVRMACLRVFLDTAFEWSLKSVCETSRCRALFLMACYCVAALICRAGCSYMTRIPPPPNCDASIECLTDGAVLSGYLIGSGSVTTSLITSITVGFVFSLYTALIIS